MINTDKILELLLFVLPAAITGAVAYYFFKSFLSNEERRRHFALLRDNQKQALPIKLQAYERLTLFLERINPAKLLVRIAPLSADKVDYGNLLVQHIEQEFEHNLTQQIYISDSTWTIILTAKNTTIQIIRQHVANTSVTDVQSLREAILNSLSTSDAPSNFALSFLKKEVLDSI
jgi:hypothetical protein